MFYCHVQKNKAYKLLNCICLIILIYAVKINFQKSILIKKLTDNQPKKLTKWKLK